MSSCVKKGCWKGKMPGSQLMWFYIKEPTLRVVLLFQRSVDIWDPVSELLKRLLVFKKNGDVSSFWCPYEKRLIWLHCQFLLVVSDHWPVLTRGFPKIVSFCTFLWKWASVDRVPYEWRRSCNMSTEDLGPALPCCPPCPAAVYVKEIDWIKKIIEKSAE